MFYPWGAFGNLYSIRNQRNLIIELFGVSQQLLLEVSARALNRVLPEARTGYFLPFVCRIHSRETLFFHLVHAIRCYTEDYKYILSECTKLWPELTFRHMAINDVGTESWFVEPLTRQVDDKGEMSETM